MKKILNVMLAAMLAIFTSSVSVSFAESIVVSGHDRDVVSIDGYVEELESNFYYKIDTSTVVTTLLPLDAMYIENDEYKDALFVFTNENVSREDDGLFEINYTTAQRTDNSDNTSLLVGEDTVNYIKSGATVRFSKPGVYIVSAVIGFENAYDRVNFNREYGVVPMYDSNIAFVDPIMVVFDVVDNGSSETTDEVGDGHFDGDEFIGYDANMMQITNKVALENKDLQFDSGVENAYIAYCSSPAEIIAQKDLYNFSLTKLYTKDGIWYRDEPMYMEDIIRPVGDIEIQDDGLCAVKKGAKFVITEPGYYEVWAEDFDGYFDGVTVYAGDIEAKYTDSKVIVDGREVKFEAYNIFDNNYFKLRDIAKVLNGTAKQFEVSWDGATSSINLLQGEAYTSVGGELAQGDGKTKKALAGAKNIKVWGSDPSVPLTAYNINDNNYFKLRDLGMLFDFGVSWDGANNCVVIDSSIGYNYAE